MIGSRSAYLALDGIVDLEDRPALPIRRRYRRGTLSGLSGGFSEARVEIFDAHFWKDQAEGDRQNDHERCGTVDDGVDEQARLSIAAEIHQADQAPGHAEEGY